jgi:hypothetical protein
MECRIDKIVFVNYYSYVMKAAKATTGLLFLSIVADASKWMP